MSEGKDIYPTSKEIITLLGTGSFILASFLFPGLNLAAKKYYQSKKFKEWQNAQREWKKFNLKMLRRNLKRLQSQQLIEVVVEKDEEVIKLTEKGKTKYLKYNLDEIKLETRKWDGRWRLVIYDISQLRKVQQEALRRILKQIKFLKLQKSVYLTPYPCKEEILYFTSLLNLNQEVLFLELSQLENESAYKTYFGLN